jgi:hypothetical protein
MISPICSKPTLLDDFEFSSSNVHLIQTHDPTEDISNNFSNINGKIVVLIFLEYHEYKWIEEILANTKNYFLTTGKLKNYYIILHAHKYQQSLYDEYKDFFTLIYEPLLYTYYTNHFECINLNRNIKYPFLSLNNRASVARQSLYYFFNKFSLLDKSYFSYLGELTRTKYKSYDEVTNEILNGNDAIWYLKNLNLNKLNQLIPFKIHNDNFTGNDWSVGNKKYYEETFCSLVFETYDDQIYPYFTEKIFKPIAFGHPFILYSNPGSLKLLQELGFKTFNEFWDEDYDLLSKNYRLEAIFHLILEISLWPLEKLIDMQNKMLPILEHNQKNFFELLPSMYTKIKPQLKRQIKQIIEDKINLV